MFIRFLMVGAAVALGFDLNPPSGNDLARWTQQGQAWCNARLSECVAWCSRQAPKVTSARSEPAPAAPEAPKTTVAAQAQPVSEDAKFETVVDRMVTAFIADQRSLPDTRPETALAQAELAPKPEAESAPVIPDVTGELMIEEEDLYPGLAFELNRMAEGLADPTPAPVTAEPASKPAAKLDIASQPKPEEPVKSASVAVAAAPTSALATAAGPSPAPAPEPESRTERFASAVRLTGQAIHAWLSLIQASAVVRHEDGTALCR